jgi:hypothetical protein
MKTNYYVFASRFVKEILGKEADSRFMGRWMGELKRLCEPEEGYPVSPDMVLGCLNCLKMGMFGFEGEIKSAYVVTYGNPPYLEQYANYISEPPPYYQCDLVREWENITGKVAYENQNHATIATHNFIPTLD